MLKLLNYTFECVFDQNLWKASFGKNTSVVRVLKGMLSLWEIEDKTQDISGKTVSDKLSITKFGRRKLRISILVDT